MKRLSFSMTFLLLATLAYAQTEGVRPDPLSPSSSGAEADGWLFLLVIPFIVVAVAVYFFIKRSRSTFRL